MSLQLCLRRRPAASLARKTHAHRPGNGKKEYVEQLKNWYSEVAVSIKKKAIGANRAACAAVRDSRDQRYYLIVNPLIGSKENAKMYSRTQMINVIRNNRAV
ncbi:MAG: hypothetical protein U0401_15690 [Anaerolineae bacterium]